MTSQTLSILLWPHKLSQFSSLFLPKKLTIFSLLHLLSVHHTLWTRSKKRLIANISEWTWHMLRILQQMERIGSSGFRWAAIGTYVPLSTWTYKFLFKTDAAKGLHLIATEYVIYLKSNFCKLYPNLNIRVLHYPNWNIRVLY